MLSLVMGQGTELPDLPLSRCPVPPSFRGGSPRANQPHVVKPHRLRKALRCLPPFLPLPGSCLTQGFFFYAKTTTIAKAMNH